MTLTEKISAVEDLFRELDSEIASFQSWSTLHCKFGCGRCCFHPEIEATVLEFLPFALFLHQNNLAESWLERIRTSDSSICHILDATREGAGLCSQYAHRGLICRLFGYSARTNKYGQKELLTCQIIKSEQSAAYEHAEADVSSGSAVPVMSEYYMKLRNIDPALTKDQLPINEAITQAIEEVMHYYAYR